MQLSEKGGQAPAVNLAGAWKYKIGPVKPVMPYSSNPNLPTVLYNGMIAPLIPFGIRGAIWYQGEANVGRAAQYEKLFPAMIHDWRSRWQEGDFPFYYVQIAPYPYGGDLTRAAALRDAQRRSLSTPNTGMVVTLDIGNPQNIHPANKQEVGRRLSLWALAHTYGEKGVICSGPLYKGLQIQGHEAVVSFENTQGGLVAKKGHLDWFELAGADGRFRAGPRGDPG
jgi:sialate O-acetylesterase